MRLELTLQRDRTLRREAERDSWGTLSFQRLPFFFPRLTT